MSYRIVWEEGNFEELHRDINQFTEKIANEVLQDMRDEVPVDTGALRDSLQVEDAGDGEFRVGSVDKEYSLFVENGTSRKGPTHFMRNALFKKRD